MVLILTDLSIARAFSDCSTPLSYEINKERKILFYPSKTQQLNLQHIRTIVAIYFRKHNGIDSALRRASF